MIDRRNCEGKPDCIRKVLEAAHAALEQNNAPYWSNDGPQDGPYFGPKNWTQLDTVSSYKLISLWWRLDHSCRGGSTIMHIDDCATREEISEYLTTIRGMCYGQHGEVEQDARWRQCEGGVKKSTTAGSPKPPKQLAGRQWDTVIRLWSRIDEKSLSFFKQQADRATGRVIVSLSGSGGYVTPLKIHPIRLIGLTM
jgi:hypothetical protein